jgi:hypothetical protein
VFAKVFADLGKSHTRCEAGPESRGSLFEEISPTGGGEMAGPPERIQTAVFISLVLKLRSKE